MLSDLNFFDGIFGDGGIYASAEDLVRWDAGLRAGTLLPSDCKVERSVLYPEDRSGIDTVDRGETEGERPAHVAAAQRGQDLRGGNRREN